AEELTEFLLRKATLTQAHHAWAMIEESYRLWVLQLRQKYNLPAQFDIDQQTGLVSFSAGGQQVSHG
ncbi:MAG: hypothetical protein ACRESL_27240, partial [Pseudomonas sp.]